MTIPVSPQELSAIRRMIATDAAQAERSAREALVRDDSAAVRDVLAASLARQGRHGDAVTVLRQEDRDNWSPGAWEIWLTVLEQRGQLAEAVAEATFALGRLPDRPQLMLRCARLHVLCGAVGEATAMLDRIEANMREGRPAPKPVQLAAVWTLGGEPQRALELLQRVPEAEWNAAVLKGMALALARLGRHTESDAVYRRMSQLPVPPEDGIRIASDLLGAGLIDEAEAVVARLDPATLAAPRSASVLSRLAFVTGERYGPQSPSPPGLPASPEDTAAGVPGAPSISSAPDTGLARFCASITRPDLLVSEAENLAWADSIERIVAEAGVSAGPVEADPARLLQAVASLQVTLLLMGRLDARLTRNLHAAVQRFLPDLARGDRPPGRRGDRIRVAIPIGAPVPMTINTIRALDPRRVETLFIVGPDRRPDTMKAIARSGRNALHVVTDWGKAHEQILAWQPDILLTTQYSAFGTFLMYRPAAPVQCAWVEPPFEDGAPACDYYLSWAAAEPDDPGRYYCSQPAFLPDPPYWITYPPERVGPGAFELPAGRRIYVCGGSLLKLYWRRSDGIIARILQGDPDGVVVLVRREVPTLHVVVRRIRETYGDIADRILILPHLTAASYATLLESADAVFDTIPFGGMSTSMESVALGVPKVTTAVPLPFGRWAASLYERIGVPELIVPNDDEAFVAEVLALARDPERRRTLGQRIRDGFSATIDNAASAAALGRYLESLAGR